MNNNKISVQSSVPLVVNECASIISPQNVNPTSEKASPDPNATPASNEAEQFIEITSMSDKDVIKKLAQLTPLDYDRMRQDAARNLAVNLRTLDAEVKACRSKSTESQRSPFPEQRPYPLPVDVGEVLEEISRTVRRYIVMDAEEADAIALWDAHTHCFEQFTVSPLLLINSPEKGCAKTLTQEVAGRMVARPIYAANASMSALFRLVEIHKPTLLIDEGDTFLRDNSDLHGMINAGYKQGGCIWRSESIGDTYEPKMFSVFSPKSIAGIALEKHLPESTLSRAIIVNLRKKLPGEQCERLRHADEQVFEVLASKLARFAKDNADRLRMARPILPSQLSDRAQDNWEPLLAIAECAGPTWVERAVRAAAKLSSSNAEAVSTSNELLMDIQDIFAKEKVSRLTSAKLIEALISDEDLAWATYNRGRPITPRQLAKLLSAYDIKPKTVRMGRNDTPKGYEYAQFEDAFARYLAVKESATDDIEIVPESIEDMFELITPDEKDGEAGTDGDNPTSSIAPHF